MTAQDPVLDLLGVQVLASAGIPLDELFSVATAEQLQQVMEAAEAVSAATEREMQRRSAEQGAVCKCPAECGHQGGQRG